MNHLDNGKTRIVPNHLLEVTHESTCSLPKREPDYHAGRLLLQRASSRKRIVQSVLMPSYEWSPSTKAKSNWSHFPCQPLLYTNPTCIPSSTLKQDQKHCLKFRKAQTRHAR